MTPKSKDDQGLMPLEELIFSIDRQLEKCPHPYAADGFEAFLGSQLSVLKRRGDPYIRFQLNSTQFALPLENALEITYKPEIAPLPNLPHWVLGICNVRGDIVSVVDLKQIFHMQRKGAGLSAHLILIRNDDMTTGIIVDKIAGIHFDREQDQSKGKKASADEKLSQFVQRTITAGRQHIHLLAVPKLMAALAIDH